VEGDRSALREVRAEWGDVRGAGARGGPDGWLPADLGQGFRGPEHVGKQREGEPHLGEGPAPIWAAVAVAREQGRWTDPRVDVLTYRNNLNKIAMTAVDGRDPWRVRCCRVEGTLVLDIVHLPERTWPGSDRFSYFGYKFEALATAARAPRPSARGTAVDETVEFVGVSRLRLGDAVVALAAEIDGCRTGGSYVELKTSRAPDEVLARGAPWDPWWFAAGSEACGRSQAVARAAHKFRRDKLPRYWFQSYIAGTPEVCVGWRDGAGMLQYVASYGTHALANACEGEWSPWTCIRLVHDVLAWLGAAVGDAACDCYADYDPRARTIAFSADPTSYRLRDLLLRAAPSDPVGPPTLM